MMKQFQSNSYLFGGNAPYVEEMYEAYLDNPASVPENWRSYFDALQNTPASDGTSANDVAHWSRPKLTAKPSTCGRLTMMSVATTAAGRTSRTRKML